MNKYGYMISYYCEALGDDFKDWGFVDANDLTEAQDKVLDVYNLTEEDLYEISLSNCCSETEMDAGDVTCGSDLEDFLTKVQERGYWKWEAKPFHNDEEA